MNIKGAIFDCDGTLVDSLGFWKAFYQKIGEVYFGKESFAPSPEDDKAMRTQAISFTAELLHKKYGIGRSAQDVEKWALEILEQYYKESVELKSGVREFLEHLKKNGVQMCIASASEAYLIKIVLSRHGVLNYFKDIISCSSVGAGKDKPDVFIAAEQFLGTPHEQTWIFEDSLLAIETAKAAGFHVVGVYDACAFGQERSRELSDEYIKDGGSFEELIPKI